MGQLTDGLNALIRYSNEITGASDGTISAAVETLVSGYGQGGGGVVDENADVLFIDYDGTPIAGYTLAEAHALTALPTPPEHEKLVFVEWNYTLAEVNNLNYPATIGACYTTYNGKTIAKVVVEGPIEVKVPTQFTGSVVWGDGVTDANSTHTYAQGGVYYIEWTYRDWLYTKINTIQFLGIEEIYFPANAFTIGGGNQMQGMPINALVLPLTLQTTNPGFCREGFMKAIILPRGFRTWEWQSFYLCYSERVSLPMTMDAIGNWGFQQFNHMKRLDLPDCPMSLGQRVCSSLYLRSIIIPDSITSVDSSFFTDARIPIVDIGAGVSSIPNYCFERMNATIEFIIRSENAILTSTNAFSNIRSDAIIYVPDASVESYKAAENWSNYASRIHPLSEIEY